jgi:glycosyltransferase 2 family protein
VKLFIKILRYTLLIAVITYAVSQLWPHFKDFSKLWALKDEIRFQWITLAVFSQAFQYVGDGWLSYILLLITKTKVHIWDAMKIASINVFAAHLLPIGEAGGMAAAFHSYRKIGVSIEKFIFLTLTWNIITNGFLILMIVLSSMSLEELPIAIKPRTFIITVICILLSLIGIYLSRKIIFAKLEKVFGQHHWTQDFFSFCRNFKTYKDMITSQPGKVLQALAGGAIYYGSNIATLYFSFMAFGVHPPIMLAVFAYAISLIFGRITLAPAGIGAAEATLILIFLNGGMDASVTVTAVLVYRLMSFWLPIPAGFLSYYSLQKHTGKAIQENSQE